MQSPCALPVTIASGLATATAPAKVNLTLHVTGQRADGYHMLDSLVVFAGVEDRITARPAPNLSLSVNGPFAEGVPTDHTNLILRAAQALRAARGFTKGAALTLEKNLPHAAGVGSGSSDAAATLRLLADLWGVPPLTIRDRATVELGADVPVCLMAPQPTRMTGIGEGLSPMPALPSCAMVLVNPRVDCPTGKVFAAMTQKDNPGMTPMVPGLDFDGFATWLAAQRNDMQRAAESIAPEITKALALLRKMPAVRVAVMSGSGATCVGLVRDMAEARLVARAVQLSEMGWWVAPAPLLS